MKILLITLLVLVCAAALVGVSYTNYQRIETQHKFELQLHDIQKYQEGFADGMNATLRHVKLATNVVEIAPILDEMKH